MRLEYKSHLIKITHSAPQLLLTYEYDQSLMDGPPFSVSNDEVRQNYVDNYKLSLIKSINRPERLKGKYAVTENVWLLAKS